MFTGLVECLGRVGRLARSGNSGLLVLEAPAFVGELALGDSLAVNGACLTVVKTNTQEVSLEVSSETLARTNLGLLGPRDQVNLERALTLSGRLGGHLVTGHVDGLGRVLSRADQGEFSRLEVSAPQALLELIVEKGSIAVDGVSLTVNSVGEGGFSVMVIPHTLASSTLGCQNSGRPVNLETDLVGKYVRKFVGGARQGEDRLLGLLAGEYGGRR
jgi:riboflavin synthase